METTVNERIAKIKALHNLGTNEFAAKAGIAPGTVWNIENGGNVSLKTQRSIATAFNLNPEWLRNGTGKMNADIVVQQKVTSDPWKEEAYATLKQANESLERKYNDLLSMFNKFIDRSGSLGKYKALDFAAFMNNQKVSRAKVS